MPCMSKGEDTGWGTNTPDSDLYAGAIISSSPISPWGFTLNAGLHVRPAGLDCPVSLFVSTSAVPVQNNIWCIVIQQAFKQYIEINYFLIS